MASRAATFDIILLFGPDIPHKPDYLPSSFLSENVEILCPADLYRENPDYGLRDVALKIVAALKQSKQVIVNDELQLSSARRSLMETVKKKVPLCEVQLVQIIPKYGFLQIMWSLYFSLAGDTFETALKSEDHMRRWFDASLQNIDYTSGFVDRPSEKEGYVLQTLSVPLQVKSHYKLDFPALFFQWEGILNDIDELNSQIQMLCGSWAESNPCGRILVICDGRNVAKGLLSSADETDSLMRCLKQLARKIKHPVYAVQMNLASYSRSFCVPPQPGMLTFLQLHHLLNLHSKSTCYIFSDIDHMKMAEAVGMKHVKISSVLKSPDVVLKGHGLTPSVPAMLRTMVVEKPKTRRDENPPTVPLFDCRHDIKDGHVSKKFPHALEEHVFVKDIENFCQYQEKFACHVTPTDQPGSNLIGENEDADKKPADSSSSSGNVISHVNIPDWMKSKRPRLQTSNEDLNTCQDTNTGISTKDSARSLKTVYIMSEKEVTVMARQILLQAGHEDVVRAADLKTRARDNG